MNKSTKYMENKMKIGIMMALNKELEFFAAQINNLQQQTIAGKTFYYGKYLNHELILAVSGMGKTNAAICTTYLINTYAVDMILNIGISGGLDSSLHIGDFILGRDIVYHDVWCGEPNLHGQVQDLPLLYHSDAVLMDKIPAMRRGLLCCGDQFIALTEELQNIKQNFPQALAVDMESAAIAQTCYLHKVPFLCVRQISDTPGIKHHQEQYDTFWQNAPINSVKMLTKILQKL